jgi:hypothetical protein
MTNDECPEVSLAADASDEEQYYLDAPIALPRRARQGKVRVGAGNKAFRCDSAERRVGVVRRRGRYHKVSRHLIPALGTAVRSARLVRSIDAQGEYFVLMVLDTQDAWNTSLRTAVEAARSRWIRVEPSRATTTFRVIEDFQEAEPDWQSAPSIDALIRDAFAGRTIDEL